MSTVPPTLSTPRLRRPWRGAATAASVGAVLMGGYLLAWAARWPHSDVRNGGASIAGSGAIVVGISCALLAQAKALALRLLGGGMALTCALLGAVALAGVSEDQVSACGSPPACESLLPGW